MTDFQKLGLAEDICKTLDQLGFQSPTKIQKIAIPKLLSADSGDFLGLAQTGTGKTAAFGLPIIDLTDTSMHQVQSVVLCPTRELAVQCGKELEQFAKNSKNTLIEVVYGGVDIVGQIKRLKRGPQIVIATPGRLLDLIKRRAINLQTTVRLVLDEADEMLNMGFKEDVDEILRNAGDKPNIWLFSATMPKGVRKLIEDYMDNPTEVSVDSEQKSNADITHQYVVTKTANKLAAIRRFLDMHSDMKGVMFCRTKRETQEIADELTGLGYGVEALHGDLSQNQRLGVMNKFKARSLQLLIATDVAARGIDVAELSHVFHHRLPDQLESYTHRSGRTGRAGKKGVSIAFINPREQRRITELEKLNNIQFEKVAIPTLDELKSVRISNWVDILMNTKVDKEAHDILHQVEERFQKLSKEDILKRLISTQLDHLMVQNAEEDDINELTSSQSRKERGKSDSNRYYINVGTIDGVTKGDLIHFIADITGAGRKQINNLVLQKNHSYFDFDSDQKIDFEEVFEFVEVNGRSIRVNQADGHTPSKPKKERAYVKRKPKPTHYSMDPNSRKGRQRSKRRGGKKR